MREFYLRSHEPAPWPAIQQDMNIMIMTLIALTAVAATHNVQLDHAGTAMEAQYSARTALETRTIGTHTPNRMDNRRCRWTATVIVDRRLANGPALARTVSRDRQFSGNEAGPCTQATASIERQMAARADTIRAHLLAAAESDRAPLLAELAAVKTMATN